MVYSIWLKTLLFCRRSMKRNHGEILFNNEKTRKDTKIFIGWPPLAFSDILPPIGQNRSNGTKKNANRILLAKL